MSTILRNNSINNDDDDDVNVNVNVAIERTNIHVLFTQLFAVGSDISILSCLLYTSDAADE